MGDPAKKGSNVTVEQMIEHMTADIQNSDGQYIPLGFTSPPANTDSHIWSEYAQNQLPQNHFMQHFGRTPEPVPYQIDPNSRFVSQNVAYNNFMAQNAIFVPEMQNNAFEKHMNMDMHGNKYVLYPGQTPQYVMTNQDLPLYMPVYPENRECPLFANQELQMQQNVLNQQNASNSGGDQLYINDNVILQQEALKNKLLMQQNMTPTQNRTHLIENLVGNWASNTNGTYSPFGNVQTQNSPTFFDLNQQEVSPQPVNSPQQCSEGLQQLLTEPPDRATSDFSAKALKSGIKKQKQVAEVKPMRPTYSDVLTKSVPLQNTPKQEKIEAKIKNQIGKKTSKNEKFSKITLNRQISNNGIDTKVDNNGSKFGDKTPSDQKVNLSRKWVSLDDVNEVHSNNDFLKSNDLNVEATSSATKSKKTKKPDATPTGANVKNENVTATNLNKCNLKKSFHVNSSLGCQWTENAENSENSKNEETNINKNPNKKGKETRSNSARQNRFSDRSIDKPPGSAKRNQRTRKKEINSTLGLFGRHVQHYMNRWSKVIFSCIMWLLHLISDIFSMSAHLGRDFGTVLWDSILIYSKSLSQNTMTLLKRVKFFTKIGAYVDKTFGNSRWAFWNRGAKDRQSSKAESKTWLTSGLEHNITMPTTGEEAMKRLLACKGKDPYSILGVRPDCTDDDIKRYYKRQAFLVHPDKNPQPGAEEAFKILVHAFDIIGEPERRQSYDRKVAESHQVEQAWSELNDLLSQLHQKMEYAANTIRCTNCTKRHRRISVDRPCYAARMCSQCKIHHSAKEGDIWAEASYFGFLWHYYACMDGAVYDITEWAGCQRKNLKHLRPNSHNVQYRIVLGKQGGQPGGGGPGGGSTHGRRHKSGGGSASEREADLENFLNNLYSQSDMSASAGTGATPPHTETGGANAARSRKKNKRKK